MTEVSETRMESSSDKDSNVTIQPAGAPLLKCLILLLCFLMVGLVVLIVIFLMYFKEGGQCNSAACIKTSALILDQLDRTIDPCRNLSDLVCPASGKAMTSADFLADNSNNKNNNGNSNATALLEALITSSTSVAGSTVSEKLQYDKASIASNADENPLFQMQKMFYKRCVDVQAIDVDQDRKVKEVIHRLGDWPILMGAHWNGTNRNWTDFVVGARDMGLKFDWFVRLEMQDDDSFSNGAEFLLKITLPKLRSTPKNRHFYYGQLLTDVAVFLGAPKNIAHYETAKIIEFEEDLGRLVERFRTGVISSSAERNETDRAEVPNASAPHFFSTMINRRRIRITDLSRLVPGVDWLQLIRRIVHNPTLQPDDWVVCDSVDYLRELQRLLTETPKRIQVDFMVWKLIEKMWPYMSAPIRDRFENYHQIVMNKRFIYSRENFCLAEARKQFRYVAEAELARMFVTPTKAAQVRRILNDVRQEMRNHLDSATWLDSASKYDAIQKLDRVTVTVGGPEEMFDRKQFSHHLGLYGFKYQSRNVIEMLMERRSRFYLEYFKPRPAGQRSNFLDFYETIISSTSFNNDYQNLTISIPAWYLQDKYFSEEVPNYVNYATIGTLIAYQLFETVYKYNENRFRWWSTNEFSSTANCLLEQYDGQLQLQDIQEQFPIMIAIQVAHRSYKAVAVSSTESKKLPALRYSSSQLFWLRLGIFLCNNQHISDANGNSITFALLPASQFEIWQDFQCSADHHNQIPHTDETQHYFGPNGPGSCWP